MGKSIRLEEGRMLRRMHDWAGVNSQAQNEPLLKRCICAGDYISIAHAINEVDFKQEFAKDTKGIADHSFQQ